MCNVKQLTLWTISDKCLNQFILFQKGTWKFGLKDLGLAQVRIAKMNIFPLAVSVGDFQNMIEEKNEEYDDNTYEEEQNNGNRSLKASDGSGLNL